MHRKGMLCLALLFSFIFFISCGRLNWRTLNISESCGRFMAGCLSRSLTLSWMTPTTNLLRRRRENLGHDLTKTTSVLRVTARLVQCGSKTNGTVSIADILITLQINLLNLCWLKIRNIRFLIYLLTNLFFSVSTRKL